MNKIILAIPVFVISSSFSDSVPTVNAAEHGRGAVSSSRAQALTGKAVKSGKRIRASWYGPKFHGKKTASGQKFNMYAMTAAHRNLPLLSYAKVTNPKNNQSVIVRINDRGPFHGQRDLDLSYAAAKKLGISGVSEVIFKPLEREQALFLLNNSGPSSI